MIDFDDMFDRRADEEPQDPRVPVKLGLVVSRKADHGDDLLEETRLFLMSTMGLPLVAFIEANDDDPAVEEFANADEYHRAMAWIRPPTVEEALAWEAETIIARIAARRGIQDQGKD
jgi:hypothetical protein